MTSNISEKLLKEKLSSWTASTKVQETLGLSSMDEASFKKELTDLESKGLIERTGAKKGLKFKHNTGKQEPVEDGEVIKLSAKIKKEKKPKKEKKVKIDVEDIPCEVTNMDRHEYTDEVNNVPLNKILTFLTKSPGDHSFSLSIKRTNKGLCVKTYRDIFLMSEVLYTKESFITLLKASGISID